MLILDPPFKKGDTFRLPFRVTDSEGGAVDISSWTVASQLRRTTNELLQDFTVSLPDGGADGQAVIEASPAETAIWPRGTHHMDIRVNDAAGAVFTTADLQLVVKESITDG